MTEPVPVPSDKPARSSRFGGGAPSGLVKPPPPDGSTRDDAFELPNAAKGAILIVDDEAINRELLVEVLESQGFLTRTAEDGESALAAVDGWQPDTVLLDVMMPGMDGFEVCRRLKSEVTTAHVPILLITALSERADRLQGISAGADDFLNKPVDRGEVMLRVRNAVVRKRLFDDLEDKYGRLKELEALRDDFTRMLVHDMRSPLTAISTNLQLLEMSLEGDAMTREVSEDLQHTRRGVGVLMDMVGMILDVSRSDAVAVELDTELVDLRKIIEIGVEPLLPLARNHEVEVRLPTDPLRIECDSDLIRRMITNLFGNALKFTPEGGIVRVDTRITEDGVQVRVEDTGPGIPKEEQVRIFDQFTRGAAGKGMGTARSTGLGLSFCKLAVEAHSGQIGVESEDGAGSLFWFHLPWNSA